MAQLSMDLLSADGTIGMKIFFTTRLVCDFFTPRVSKWGGEGRRHKIQATQPFSKFQYAEFRSFWIAAIPARNMSLRLVLG